MPSVGFHKLSVAIATAGIAVTIWAVPALCQDSASSSTPAAVAAIEPATGSQDSAASSDTATPKKHTLREKIKNIVDAVPARLQMDRDFKIASALFPSFCQHWQKDLQDRESNNRNHLNFVAKDGYQTATYTGYGKIEECESHQSRQGFSIGRITYEEFQYYVTGKTSDEAMHAAPQTVSDTHTTELFRWDNNKWFY